MGKKSISKPTRYFFPVGTWFRYFDGPCLTIYSPSTLRRGIHYPRFWSGGFTTATAVNRTDRNIGNSLFVHFDMTCLTTLTGILDFANLILFQTWILQAEKSSSNLGKNPVHQTRYFKLENCKNQVQIDRGHGLYRVLNLKPHNLILQGSSSTTLLPSSLSHERVIHNS